MSDDGPKMDRKKAKEHVKKLLAKPEHKGTPGDARDLETREDDLADPAKQKE